MDKSKFSLERTSGRGNTLGQVREWFFEMSEQESEADARILIDALLRQPGWDPADKSQVRTEISVSGAEPLHDAPTGALVPETEDSRRTDYILLATNGRPLAVIEAKRTRIDPYTAKHQTLP